MGTNLAEVSLMFLYTHTYTHTHTHTPPPHPLLSTPLSLSPFLSQVTLLFVMFRGQHQSVWGMGGYSVLKEMLFHKNGHSPFSRKYRGHAAAALQSCPENFPWNDFDFLHLKGTNGGFSPWCLARRSLSSRCSWLFFNVVLSCHMKGAECEFNSSHRRAADRRKTCCSTITVCWQENPHARVEPAPTINPKGTGTVGKSAKQNCRCENLIHYWHHWSWTLKSGSWKQRHWRGCHYSCAFFFFFLNGEQLTFDNSWGWMKPPFTDHFLCCWKVPYWPISMKYITQK